jgi:hypothetical protein
MSAEDLDVPGLKAQPSEPFTVQMPDGSVVGGADTAADAIVIAAAAAQLIGMATGGGISLPQITVVDGSTSSVVAWVGSGSYP